MKTQSLARSARTVTLGNAPLSKKNRLEVEARSEGGGRQFGCGVPDFMLETMFRIGPDSITIIFFFPPLVCFRT